MRYNINNLQDFVNEKYITIPEVVPIKDEFAIKYSLGELKISCELCNSEENKRHEERERAISYLILTGGEFIIKKSSLIFIRVKCIRCKHTFTYYPPGLSRYKRTWIQCKFLISYVYLFDVIYPKRRATYLNLPFDYSSLVQKDEGLDSPSTSTLWYYVQYSVELISQYHSKILEFVPEYCGHKKTIDLHPLKFHTEKKANFLGKSIQFIKGIFELNKALMEEYYPCRFFSFLVNFFPSGKSPP